jgi:beta-phosphoglucomutase
MAAQQLGVPAENCIVFEDAVAGIQAANAAKMISIGIGDARILSEAKFNFSDFMQIELSFLDDLIL